MDCHYSCGSGTRDKGPQELPDREFELKTQGGEDAEAHTYLRWQGAPPVVLPTTKD
jgi:hypothetical protein